MTNNTIIEEMINQCYSDVKSVINKARSDERDNVIEIIHSFFRDELENDIQMADMILYMNKKLCRRIKEQK